MSPSASRYVLFCGGSPPPYMELEEANRSHHLDFEELHFFVPPSSQRVAAEPVHAMRYTFGSDMNMVYDHDSNSPSSKYVLNSGAELDWMKSHRSQSQEGAFLLLPSPARRPSRRIASSSSAEYILNALTSPLWRGRNSRSSELIPRASIAARDRR